MKKILSLLFLTGLHCHLYAQVFTEITGTIKSPQGAMQGAEITFLNLNEEFEGNCISGPDGRFKSQSKFQLGRTVKIKVSASGYETAEKTLKVDSTGNAGEFMLQRKKLTVSGFVRDSISEVVVEGAEIFFYDDATLIQKKSTNSQGYFVFETNFSYGQRITIRVSKMGFYDKEQTLTFTSEGRNTLPDILLPQIGDRGLRAFIKVVDKKRGKPMAGVTVRYLDRKRSSYIDTVTTQTGQVELKLYQRPGTLLDLEIIKPNYRTIRAKPTLNEQPDNNKHEYEMERDRRSALGPVLLIGAGVAGLTSGGMFVSSNSSYDSYKDFSNPNRESDYTTAQNKRKVAVAAAAVAGGAMAGYLIYKITQKNKEKDLEQKRIRVGMTHFEQPALAYTKKYTPLVALVFAFN